MTDEAPQTSAETSAEEETPAAALPADPVLAELATAFPTVQITERPGSNGAPQVVAVVPADTYHELVAAARAAGYDTFIDLCGVDYLHRRPRYEVVLNLLDMDRRARLRIRVGVSGTDPVVATVTDLFPGANFFERETYDLFGIHFDGHPDLTRILLPDDWEGYPLRKDYSVGSVPVQFKGAHRAS